MKLPSFLTPHHRTYVFFDAITAVFVTVLVISNVASGAKIIDLGSIGGWPLSIDAGTLLFPLSYIFGDILTEVYGFARSRRVIWIGFLCLLLSAVSLWVTERLPGEAGWQEYAGDQAYTAILGSMSSGAIVLASLTAYFLGEFTNSVLLAKLKVWMSGRRLWVRTIGSTIVGQAIDTTVFTVLAAAFGVFPWAIVPSLIVTVYLCKVFIEVVCTPLTYAVVGFLKRVEHEDYYDRRTNFSPFAL